MTSEEIKSECELMYNQIKSAETRLKELRAMCKHEHIREGYYSHRRYNFELSEICSDCGAWIKSLASDEIRWKKHTDK